ncbi:hypothetical protein LTR62_007952 [Meristemomyces frigidus]|uniref:DOC domain-containing protein n=1 Tax=Meristemomyces frigidus TaxID=1508187 RepID=A0AAN7TPS2_9PEZI|nr:hypothetical protein LTR62_007952 [Meristemomyces frigidus]
MPARTHGRQATSDVSSEILSDLAPTAPHALMEIDPDQDGMAEGEDGDEDDEDDEEEEEEGAPDDGEPEIFPPPGLKEISSLASWTVSTAKPGNGVAALRSPDPAHFWQSDGPQPHLLSIHFFKLVSVVAIHVLLDFNSDESYTPTKIQFLAGMGVHDIQEFAEMSFEQPNGWHSVDFSNVGPIEQDDPGEENDDPQVGIDWSKRPVLRAFLVQVRILENHQNGKDTHLRGVRIFSRDEMHQPTECATPRLRSSLPGKQSTLPARDDEQSNVKLASWMQDPDLR